MSGVRGLLAIVALSLFCLVPQARAQTVAVRSGDHDGFSRLVLAFPSAVDWTLTRTDDGYVLATGSRRPRYDLGDVFRRITRDRLAAIWADPETGVLRLLLACACHAMPFELQPGVVVIDLRDGPAPPASDFERGADGARMAPLVARAPIRPRPRPVALPPPAMLPQPVAPVRYDWLATRRDRPAANPSQETAPDTTPASPPPAAQMAGADPAALRDALVRQIARGAARGVLDPADRLPDASELPRGILPERIRIGAGDPGAAVDIVAAEREAGMMTAAGEACLTDAALDIASWGDPRPVAKAMGPLVAGVLGEFDRPDAPRVTRAVQYLLHLGFGAEARQMMATHAPSLPEAALYGDMAAILDGSPAPGGVLRGQHLCDSAAALWSVQAAPGTLLPARTNDAAVLRAFSALPLHLRRQLAPGLTDRYLAAGRSAEARAIRDAVLRAPGDPGPAVRLMEADIAAAAGAPVTDAALADIGAGPGLTGALATAALVERRARSGEVVATADFDAISALVLEYRGTEHEAALRRARALAEASRGDFDSAFASAPEAAAEIWALLAGAADGPFLRHAIRPPDLSPPLPAETQRVIAARLADHGFPEPTLAWLAIGAGAAAPQARNLAAQAELSSGDARAALRRLAGASDGEAPALRAAALARLRAPEGPAALREVGAEAEARQLARALGLWEEVAALDAAPWAEVAARRSVPTPDASADPAERADAEGPLAANRALLDDSAAVRSLLAQLLTGTAVEGP